MSSVKLSPEQWAKILEFLRGCAGLYVGQEAECQRFIEGVLWMSRSGAQWRLLPAEYGNWNSVYKRFARWADRGIWRQMHQCFADDIWSISSLTARWSGPTPAPLAHPPKGWAGSPGPGPKPRRFQH